MHRTTDVILHGSVAEKGWCLSGSVTIALPPEKITKTDADTGGQRVVLSRKGQRPATGGAGEFPPMPAFLKR
ncbi:hypothetical protein WD174_005034 [Salmonella enterica]|nr:hypothetical protein [Salmonella enterica]ECE0473634.1 hypothetical protein [Salmonella enterica subsp. enterica serovar Glostrup]EHA9227468.1 hypothetical protein [Salmonella enterica subsp. enterica serovar Glostrup]EHB5302157.1 hypothetical protein [Salmonella enterica subsp. enterica serovar Sandiego]EKO4980822.1 hypothetical protein [Salmonella enterica]